MPERILPVLVGAGQTIDRPADPAAGREPLVLMEEAARRPASAPPWGDGRPGVSAHEARHGIGQPIVTYPMVENAFRAARRLSLEAHRRELAAFAARAAAIAAENPYAWFRDAKDAATLATVTAENRMVGFPYPKFMNAILDVNQGAALVLASEAAARRLALAAARWVYPWAGVDVTEHWFFQDRVDYHTLPRPPPPPPLLPAPARLAIPPPQHLPLHTCFPIA